MTINGTIENSRCKRFTFCWEPSNYLGLVSDQFLVRSLTKDDISESYISWLNDPQMNAYTNSRNKTHTQQSCKHYLESFDNKVFFHVGIFDKTAHHCHIGNFSIRVDQKNMTASTTVIIGEKSYWGTGVVITTRAMVMNFLFEVLKIYKITGTPYSRNIPAILNYKKQEFLLEGIQKDQILLKPGVRCDLLHFAYFA